MTFIAGGEEISEGKTARDTRGDAVCPKRYRLCRFPRGSCQKVSTYLRT